MSIANPICSKSTRRQSLESGGGVRLLRTFHASQCICDMGTKGTVLCDWRSCGICNIVKSGFACVAFGAPGNKGRSVQCSIPQPFLTLNSVYAFQTRRWPVFFHGSLRGGPVCDFMPEFTVPSYGCLRCRSTAKSEPK